jgi:hypothetical protein
VNENERSCHCCHRAPVQASFENNNYARRFSLFPSGPWQKTS